MELTKEYIHGFLEHVGSFQIIKTKKSVICRFIITTNIKNIKYVQIVKHIADYFKSNNLDFNSYRMKDKLVYAMQHKQKLLELIAYFEDNLILEKKNLKAIKKLIEKKNREE
jgi:hypothetical protein